MRFLLFLLFCGPALATSYYVKVAAAGGSDAADGLADGTAWATPEHAMATIGANDVVYFRRGDRWVLSATFDMPADGIRLSAYGSGPLPVLDGASVLNEIVDCAAAQNTITEYLELRNGGPEGGDLTGGSWTGRVGTNTLRYSIVNRHASDALVDGSGDAHIVVQGCLICGSFDDGVTLHSTSSGLIEDCTIANCSEGINNSGTDMALTLNRVDFVNNSDDLAGLSACVTTFNSCRWLYGATSGGVFYSGGDSAVTFNYCLFDASQGPGVANGEIAPQAAGATVMNNCVLYGGGNGKISLSNNTLTLNNCILSEWWRAASLAGSAEFHKDHCITYNIDNGTVTSNTSEVGTADPLFVAPTTGNFRLQGTSPGLNAGANLSLTTDLGGMRVAPVPDLGCYEYSTATLTPGTMSATRLIIR